MLAIPEIIDEIKRLKVRCIVLENEIARLVAILGNNPPAPPEPTPTVATPVISPDTQSFEDELEITITCATSGASIYYTDNGSTPTTGSTLYSGPFEITATKTIKAIAVKAEHNNSGVATESYTLVTGPFTVYTAFSPTEILPTSLDEFSQPVLDEDKSTIAGAYSFPYESEAVPEYRYIIWPVAQGFPRAVDGFRSTNSPFFPIDMATAEQGFDDATGNGWHAHIMSIAGVPHYVFRRFNATTAKTISVQV